MISWVETGDKKWKITLENNHSLIPEDELEDWVVPGEALDALAVLVEPFLFRFWSCQSSAIPTVLHFGLAIFLPPPYPLHYWISMPWVLTFLLERLREIADQNFSNVMWTAVPGYQIHVMACVTRGDWKMPGEIGWNGCDFPDEEKTWKEHFPTKNPRIKAGFVGENNGLWVCF